MKGSCLCGQVAFEFEHTGGAFELCHCSRCRKATGSAHSASLEVGSDAYRLVRGREHVRRYQAPLLETPPHYVLWFCTCCGGPVPDPKPAGDTLVIPAGTLDDHLPVRPDKHIYADLKADWDVIDGTVAVFTRQEIRAFRARYGRVPFSTANDS